MWSGPTQEIEYRPRETNNERNKEEQTNDDNGEMSNVNRRIGNKRKRRGRNDHIRKEEEAEDEAEDGNKNGEEKIKIRKPEDLMRALTQRTPKRSRGI